MRIVTLEPFLTDLVCALGREAELVGVSRRCVVPAALTSVPRLTLSDDAERSGLVTLSRHPVQLEDLVALRPDLVLTTLDCTPEEMAAVAGAVTEALRALGCPAVKVRSYDPRTLDGVFDVFERVGTDLGMGARGRELAQRTRAQFMDWADSFYERTKNKRVTFLESVEPFRLGGLWIPDMIRFASAVSQEPPRGEPGAVVSWDEIVRFNPDVMIVAPTGCALNDSAALFKRLEQLPAWETIAAVKRGEVIFAAGDRQFESPGPHLRDAMGVLVSAIAGLESGYITPRDTFYRLRWVELQRHRFGAATGSKR